MDRSGSARPRVLVVGEGPPTRGGIPTFVTRLTSDPWLRERAEIAYMNTTPPGVKVPGAANLSNLRWGLGHARRIRRLARGVDVIHLNVAATPTLPLARAIVLAAAARSGGAAVVVHAHTGQLEECMRRPIYRALLGRMRGLADAFVVVSSSGRDAVAGLGPIVRLVDNGVDLAEIPPPGPKPDPPLLTFVGTVAERKGLVDLADALVLLRSRFEGRLPFRVAIAGDGRQEGPGAFEHVRRAFSNRGLDEVEFLGALERPSVLELLGRASVFCLPSHSEGLPLAVLEAMGAGNAIVASAVGDIPRALEDGRAGMLVPPRTPAALADALAELAADPDARARLGAAARRRVEERFGQERTIRELFELYAELADRGPRTPCAS